MYWIALFCLFFQLLSSEISPYLKECSLTEDQIIPLTGGYSGSQHYQIVERNLVLKIYPKGYQPKRELAVMLQAAEIGIAPKIHWISEDRRAVLMDWIEGHWLTIAEAKKPETIIAVGAALRKVHALPQSPYIRRNSPEELIEYLNVFPPELAPAMEKKKELRLPENSPKVTTHGDLNPRNIFLTPQGVQLIDWSETCFDDPFFDLTTFAILHDLNEAEETLLLQTYIGNRIYRVEKERYDLVKKINLIDQAINLIFLANQLSDDLQNGPVESGSYYVTRFAEETLSPQEFYDWGRCWLRN